MKPGLFLTLILVAALAIAAAIYSFMLPDYIKAGGPLVVALVALSIMVAALILERLFVLRNAQGKDPVEKFLTRLQGHVETKDIDAAIWACDVQRGSCANILRAGLERFRAVRGKKDAEKVTQDVQTAIQESTMLEVPLLERNLAALSTIASISTLTGLLGTTFGMIRSFKALARSGAPDAIALSLGISEALVNTAGGLLVAILGIVAYNYFFTRIDDFTYTIDEATLEMVETLTAEPAEALTAGQAS
jgi:biopolymer transport protein ExbB